MLGFTAEAAKRPSDDLGLGTLYPQRSDVLGKIQLTNIP
jgi:hypothetical protein